MNNIEMKKPKLQVIIAIVLSGIIIIGVCFMFFRNNSNSNNGTKRITDSTITDMERLNLRLSGMRLTEEYEFIVNGDKTEISYYKMSYANSEEERILEKRTVWDTKTVIDALNGFDVIKWDGFHGKHPKGVLDGTTFKITATLNGGQKLYADGSQNFPKHFHEFEKWLYTVFKDSKEIR